MFSDRWVNGLSLEETLLELLAPARRNEILELRKHDSLISSFGLTSFALEELVFDQ